MGGGSSSGSPSDWHLLKSGCGQFSRGPPTLQRRSSPRRGHVSSYTCLRVARNNTWSVGGLTLQPVKGRWRGNECRGLLRQLAMAWSVGDSHPPPGSPCNTWSVGGRTLKPLSSGKGRFTAVCAVESQYSCIRTTRISVARVQLTLVLQAVSGIRLREPVQDVVRGWLYIEAPLIGNGSVYSSECQ